MSAGQGGAAASTPDGSPAPLDGAFLLQLLSNPPRATAAAAAAPPTPPREDPHRHPHDPAVRAVGPSVPFLPHNFFPPPTNPMSVPPVFHQPPWFPPGFSSPSGPAAGAHLPFVPQPGPSAAEDRRRDFRFSPRDGVSVNHARHNSSGISQGRAEIDSRQQKTHIVRTPSLADRNHYRGEMVRSGPAASVEFQRPEVVDRGRQLHRKHYRGEMVRSGPAASVEFQRPGVADCGRQLDPVRRGSGEWVPMNERRERKSDTEVPQKVLKGRNTRIDSYSRMEGVKSMQGVSLGSDQGWQLDQSMKAVGNSQLSDDRPEVEDSVGESQDENGEDAQGSKVFAAKAAVVEGDVLAEEVEESLIIGDDSAGKSVIRQVKNSRSKTQEIRFDSLRGHNVSSQRMRIRRRMMACRHDIETSTPLLLSIFESLIPPAEEKAKQKQLLLSLGKLVNKEWPNAQLHLYGSCANSFGVLKSDIDVCLAINEDGMSRSEILLKLADILQSDDLENVQALTHARVPIVKLMDPVTGISCDICINNLLAVVNTKLLRDYAQIDDRLRQLAFIVKHWAKSRGVNETYRGTLSSYAYVLMCIHFLQQRKPAILPCLQQMEATYIVTVDDTECAYFDKVERLRNFGSQNKESIAQLLWAFFHYWAYCHDYVNDVISVRTGSILSKRVKDWTRRIGNDRHLICIEDPFEVSHDLGRVVDKYSIKILREEFERAADILQYNPNPSVTLFEPYVPGSPQDQILLNLEHQS